MFAPSGSPSFRAISTHSSSPSASDVFQYEWVLRNIIERLGPNKPVTQILSILAERKSKDLQGDIGKVLSALSKVSPKETLKYQNVVRALICLNSDDFSISSLGLTWLQGQTLEDDERKALGFSLSIGSSRARSSRLCPGS